MSSDEQHLPIIKILHRRVETKGDVGIKFEVTGGRDGRGFINKTL